MSREGKRAGFSGTCLESIYTRFKTGKYVILIDNNACELNSQRGTAGP